MNEAKKAACMQTMFSLMGKAACIHVRGGEEVEGIVKGVLLDGVELITMQGVRKLSFDDIIKTASFSDAAGKKKAAPGNAAAAKEDLRVKRESFSGTPLEFEILFGTPESLSKSLRRPDFCRKAGLDAEEAATMAERLKKPNLPWGEDPLSQVFRYRVLMQDKADSMRVEGLYQEAISLNDPASLSTAILELLRLYIKRKAYKEVITLYEAHAASLGEHAYAQMTAYSTALGYIQGVESLEAYLKEHTGLATYSTNEKYFEKLIRKLRQEEEAAKPEKEEEKKAEASLYAELEVELTRTDYTTKAVESGKEADYLDLYNFLYETGDSDAPILAAFMLYNSRIWNSAQAISDFETLCKKRYLVDVQASLVGAFEEALAKPDPEEGLRFLQKWHPLGSRDTGNALRVLLREGHAEGSAEVVTAMAAAYNTCEAWRRLQELYKHKGVECEGNILYAIAYYSHDQKDLGALQTFATKNGQILLQTAASLLRMSVENQNTMVLRGACQKLAALTEAEMAVPSTLLESFFTRLAGVASVNESMAAEVLHAGQKLALKKGFSEEFLKICMPQMSRHPKTFAVFALEAYRQCPENVELCEKLRGLLLKAGDFEGKALAMELLDTPEALAGDSVEACTATHLIVLLTGLNVRKMYMLICEALADAEEEEIGFAVQSLSRLALHFPAEGLLAEMLYYFLSVEGKTENAGDMYRALYQYLLQIKSEPKLFVHYAKRLYCGLVYLEKYGTVPPATPQNADEMLQFCSGLTERQELWKEFENFRHRIVMLERDEERFPALLFAGLCGNWQAYMDILTPVPERVFSETDMFIHEVGRYNFLRSLARRLIVGEPWEQFSGFLSEAERVQMDAVAAVGYGEAEKRMAHRILRSKVLDRTGSGFLAEKVFSAVSPETFGKLLPVMRTLMLDSVLIEALRDKADDYLEEAAKTVLEQKETVPHQIYSKTYRDFMRSFSNLLFSRGLYKEAGPIFGLLFETDEDAFRHNAENRYANLTHAVCRQKQKFCNLVCRDPEEVDKFHTTTEYMRIINIFAVHFASDRLRDLNKIAPLMTVLQKKLCAAVYYVLKESFEEFAELAQDIWNENPAMGEVLFAFAQWRAREMRWQEFCRRYLPQSLEEDEERKYFFISPRPNTTLRYFPIYEALELGQDPKDGAEAHVVPLESDDKAERIRPAIRVEEFREMSLVKYALGLLPEMDSIAIPSFRDAFARYSAVPTFENGMAVLLAEDFADASEALLRSFCASFAICLYREAEERGDDSACESFTPDFLRCFSPVSALTEGDAELLGDVLESIFIRFESFEDYNRYYARHASHILSLLKASATQNADTYRIISLYCTVAKNVLSIEESWDGERKLSVIREQNRAIAECSVAGKEELVSDLARKVNDAADMLRENPLLTIRLDSLSISVGNLLTGYVENEGHEAAEDAVLRITLANGETQQVQMRRLYGDYKAPFAFPLGMHGAETGKISLSLSYTFEGETRHLGKILESVTLLPRQEYPLNLLPGLAIPVEETEKHFIGRAEEIRAFENEFFTMSRAENGEVERKVRTPVEIPAMVVNGPKRVGKSSLLHRVEKIVAGLSRDWVYVHFDAQDVKSVYEAFVKEFSMHWRIDGMPIAGHPAYEAVRPLEPPKGEPLTMADLGRYYKACRDTFAPGKKILYVLDEIETVIRHSSAEDFFNMLQYAMKNLSDVISFLICGSDDLTNIMFEMENRTQFFQIAKNFPVGKMPRHEYEELLEAFSQRTGLYPDAAAKEGLWLLTRGQIYYTHMIFNCLIDLYRKQPILCSREDMRLYDVYVAFDALHGGSEIFSGLSGMFDAYGSGEKEVIEEIADYAVAPGEGVSLDIIRHRLDHINVEKALSRLEARGFVSFSGGQYSLSSEMYRIAFGKYATATLYFRN